MLPEGGLCKGTQTCSSRNGGTINSPHVFRIGCINEERLRVSSTDLHLESFNTLGQNQPALFYEQLISLDKTPFVWFYVPLSAQIEAAQELFSVSAGISVTLP